MASTIVELSAPIGSLPSSSIVASASSSSSGGEEEEEVVVAGAVVDAASSRFCGEFADPINHPGGTRTISLVGGPDIVASVGDYRLAKVTGGGGRGVPGQYGLPGL